VAVVRARPAAVTRLSSYYSFDVRETTAEGVILAVRFPTRDVAIVELLVLGNEIDLIGPTDLREAIVGAARTVLDRFSL